MACLATGLIVGIWWSAWHLLTERLVEPRRHLASWRCSVFLTATAIGVFVGYLTAFRVLMVWLYDRTESLFVAMLMHVSLTASLLILNPLGITGANLVIYLLRTRRRRVGRRCGDRLRRSAKKISRLTAS